MCNETGIAFVANSVRPEEVHQKRVIESGSQNVNGSVRSTLETFGPAVYIGTDITTGYGVDEVCNAVDLVATYGAESFDVLVSTEMIEHAEDWRGIISNFKRILKPGGVLFVTTRSEGFGWHGYPHDYWRYSVEDMKQIFEDFEILSVQDDPREPGVFVKARKPLDFVEKDLSAYQLFSINTLQRSL